MAIRPSFLELSIFKGQPSVADHLLRAYRASFAGIIKSQFGRRALPDGEEGALALAEAVHLDTVLLTRGMDPDSLRDASAPLISLESTRSRQLESASLLLGRLACCSGRAIKEPLEEHSGPKLCTTSNLSRGDVAATELAAVASHTFTLRNSLRPNRWLAPTEDDKPSRSRAMQSYRKLPRSRQGPASSGTGMEVDVVVKKEDGVP